MIITGIKHHKNTLIDGDCLDYTLETGEKYTKSKKDKEIPLSVKIKEMGLNGYSREKIAEELKCSLYYIDTIFDKNRIERQPKEKKKPGKREGTIKQQILELECYGIPKNLISKTLKCTLKYVNKIVNKTK